MSISGIINRIKTNHQLKRLGKLRGDEDSKTFQRQLAEEEIKLLRERKETHDMQAEARTLRFARVTSVVKSVGSAVKKKRTVKKKKKKKGRSILDTNHSKNYNDFLMGK